MVLEFVKPARFSRKIFVGGLPNGISEHELFANFHRFGYAHIDWPHKSYNDLLPPSGFAFIIFEDSAIVERIMQSCTVRDNKYMFVVKMVSGMSKEVELKAWELKNNELILASNWHDFERLTIFVGGLPRTITATELAKHLQEAVGGVAYVRIEVDETTEYPKGSARVVLCARESYVRAIAMRDFAVVSGGMERQAEIKPYIHHKMPCEGCGIQLSAGFCSNIRCLKYFCDNCWRVKHSAPGMGSHRPMQKSRYLHQSKKSSNHTADEHLRFSMSVPSSDTPYWLNTATDLSPAWLSASNLEHLKMAPAWSSSPKLGNTESSPFWLKSPNLDELDKITSKLAPIFSSSPSFASSGQEAPWPKSHSLEDLDDIPNWPALSPFGSSDQSTEESSFMNWRDFKKNLEQFDGYDSGYVTSSAEASPFSESVFDFASKYPF